MSGKKYYYVDREQEIGPVSGSEIKELAASGKIGPKTQIRGESSSWVVAEKVKGLTFCTQTQPASVLALVSPALQEKSERDEVDIAAWISGGVDAKPGLQPERIQAAEQTIQESKSKVAGRDAVCPYCAETVAANALKCKHCGEFLDAELRKKNQPKFRKWNPGVAAVLSFLLPGLGQLYKGQLANGLAWLFVVIVGYALLVLPGVVLHICCVYGAAQGDPYA